MPSEMPWRRGARPTHVDSRIKRENREDEIAGPVIEAAAIRSSISHANLESFF